MKITIDGIEILEISDTELKCLENDLLNVEDWIKQAIVGKINNCKKRMIREWQPKLFADSNVTTVPATDNEFISVVIARDDYKNRVERDEDLINLK